MLIIALLAIAIFVVLPAVVKTVAGGWTATEILADIGLGLIVIGPVILVLGAVPFITAVIARQKRINRIKREDRSDDQKHG